MSSRRTAIVLLRSAEDNGKNKLQPVIYSVWKRTAISTYSHLKTCYPPYHTFWKGVQIGTEVQNYRAA